jgi:two-component system chemotaxis response regulator CheY
MITKILVVDDSLVSRKIMKSCIPADRGYEIYEASNGQEGVERYKDVSPDVTFMDLTMPVMDGVEALDEIKSFDERAVVIVCTADVQMKTISRVMFKGALMVVKKPITRETIHDALNRAEQTIAS